MKNYHYRLEKMRLYLLVLAFIEGGAVMCVELCSAKLLTPYFGTSIYIWAAVLGITLTALMSGYYLGGYLTSRKQDLKTILWMMFFGGILVTLTPIISDFILPIAINMNLVGGSILALFSFLLFPLICFGATSPLLINLFTDHAKESGRSSGTVYSISTLGGIVTTFIIGFYTLPVHGITTTLYSYGVLVMAYTCFLFIRTKKFKTPVVILLIIAAMSFNFKLHHSNEVIHHSEGILGEIKVVDRVLYSHKDGRNIAYRSLLVNNISQTVMNMENPEESIWDYVDVLTYNLNAYNKGHKTLLLGLGGGTLYKKLNAFDYEVDVVELDERIASIATEYFGIEKDINITIDDARHYLKVTNKKYDVIIYDLFQAETPPSHLMTKEAFNELKSNLTENGILVVNFFGFINGKAGKAARSIYKTLHSEGYNIRLFATKGEESYRNLIFICSQKELEARSQLIHSLIYEMDLNLEDAEILVDDKPTLEHLYIDAALSWRRDYNEYNTKYLLLRKQ